MSKDILSLIKSSHLSVKKGKFSDANKGKIFLTHHLATEEIQKSRRPT